MTRASARQGPAPQPPRPSVQMEEGAFLQLRPLWGLRWSSVTRQESYGKGVPAQGRAGSRGRRRLQILGSCIWVTGQRAEPGPRDGTVSGGFTTVLEGPMLARRGAV